MTREEFDKKLGTLLDMLGTSDNEDLVINVSNRTDTGMSFTVWFSSIYIFRLCIFVGDVSAICIQEIGKQGILDMFTEEAIREISTIEMSIV